jgi:Spy/CpxP family protein refolding chaperone
MDERSVILLFTALLDLTDSQRAQMTTIFDAAVAAAAPAATQLDENKDALYQAAKSGKTDDQIKSMAEQEASLTSKLLTLQVQTFSKMLKLLNPDQQSKVDASMYAHIGDFITSARQP